MAHPNPLNATFFAFRHRESGGVLTQLALGYVLLSSGLTAAFVYLTWGSIVHLLDVFAALFRASAAGGPVDASTTNVGLLPLIFFGLIGAMIPFAVLSYMVRAAFEAGALRWMIRDERAGALQFTWDSDTWRVWGLYWVWLVLRIAIGAATGLVAVIIFAVAGGRLGEPNLPKEIWEFFAQCITVYIALRFAPAAAVSIMLGRMTFGKALDATDGRVWALLGSYILLGLIWLCIYVVVIGASICVLFFPEAMALAPQIASMPPRAFVEAMITLAENPQNGAKFVVLLLISAFVGAWGSIAFFGVHARAAIAAEEDGKLSAASA